MTTKGLVLASTALLFPWTNLFLLAAVGVGGVLCVVRFVQHLDTAPLDDPSRCPACRRDDLLRIEGSARHPSPVALLHCRSCGEAFRMWNGSLVRDTGRPLL